jgi:hypothetical protein
MSRDVVMNADAACSCPTTWAPWCAINHGWGTVRLVNSPTQVTVNILQRAHRHLAGAAGEWSCTRPVTTVSGLHHLEGETCPSSPTAT